MAPRLALAALLAPQCEACPFAGSSSRSWPAPADEVHRALGAFAPKPELIPDRLSTKGNAFISESMLRPAPGRGDVLLADELADFASTQGEDMCYWSFQPLAPPAGDGRDLRHPFRHHWDIANGQWDEDLEWQGALANTASARLKRIQDMSNGTLVSTMCATGRDIARRRCRNGRAKTDSWMDSCMPAVRNQHLRWGMAITIWKISPELKHWVRYWRSNQSFGHVPNIQWVYRGGHEATQPWNDGAPLPTPYEIDPEGAPHGPFDWPASKGQTWGSGSGAFAGDAMLAKLLPCSQVPAKFRYPQEEFFCNHISEGASQTTADEAYEYWKDIESSWPPTKECSDDVTLMNTVLANLGVPSDFTNCADAMHFFQSRYRNWNCDANFPGAHQFRDFCCSQCGSRPVPNLPKPPAPTPPPARGVYVCSLCGHKYDSAEDGAGTLFDELPDSWTCPICGMPKAVYKKVSHDALV